MLESDKIDYKSAGKAPSLEVPPDLSQLSRENRYAVPGGPVSANAYEAGKANGGTCDGEPGPRERAPNNSVGAYLRDPDGNKICAFHMRH